MCYACVIGNSTEKIEQNCLETLDDSVCLPTNRYEPLNLRPGLQGNAGRGKDGFTLPVQELLEHQSSFVPAANRPALTGAVAEWERLAAFLSVIGMHCIFPIFGRRSRAGARVHRHPYRFSSAVALAADCPLLNSYYFKGMWLSPTK